MLSCTVFEILWRITGQVFAVDSGVPVFTHSFAGWISRLGMVKFNFTKLPETPLYRMIKDHAVSTSVTGTSYVDSVGKSLQRNRQQFNMYEANISIHALQRVAFWTQSKVTVLKSDTCELMCSSKQQHNSILRNWGILNKQKILRQTYRLSRKP